MTGDTLDKTEVIERLQQAEKLFEEQIVSELGYCKDTGDVHTHDMLRFEAWDEHPAYAFLAFPFRLIARTRVCRRCGEVFRYKERRRAKPYEWALEQVQELIQDVKNDFKQHVDDMSYRERKRYKKAQELLEWDVFNDADTEEELLEIIQLKEDCTENEAGNILDAVDEIQHGDVITE